MTVYLLKLKKCIKIGVSTNIESRLKVYKSIEDKFLINLEDSLLNEVYARFIESSMMEYYDSETEFIYNADFSEAIQVLKDILKNLPNKTFHLSFLDIDVFYNKKGYVDLANIIEYVNNERRLKGKPLANIEKYLSNNTTKAFLDILKKDYKKKPIISKVGKYGGRFALPIVALDFIMWAEPDLKVSVLNYMYKNAEYLHFVDIAKAEVIK